MNIRSPTDLLNVDYDDVLQLYRGWRRSEEILKEKDKELVLLRSKTAQLEDALNKFRMQIKALENVKEVTISLQTQLSVMQEENHQLSMENKELLQNNERLSEQFQEKLQSVDQHIVTLTNTQKEHESVRKNYEDLLASKSMLETVLTNEQMKRKTIESSLAESQTVAEEHRRRSLTLESELREMRVRMAQCDSELAQASEQLKSLSKDILEVKYTNDQILSLERQNKILKTDMTRLIRLLEHSPATRAFLESWKDSEAMSFLGLGKSTPGDGRNVSFTSNSDTRNRSFSFSNTPNDSQNKSKTTNMYTRSYLDDTDISESLNNTSSRYLNKRDVDDSMDLTMDELRSYQKKNGEDIYPMTSSIQDELEVWVPREAYDLGMSFISSRMPHAPRSVIKDFLRDMNRIFLKREKRNAKRIRAKYIGVIRDLRRQLGQAKPYKGVMAERQIRMLRARVQEEREKSLKSPSRIRTVIALDSDDEDEDYDDMGEQKVYNTSLHTKHSRRSSCLSCSPPRNRQSQKKPSILRSSTEKLLNASLTSLELLGKHIEDSKETGLIGETGAIGGPSVEFINGAIWLGRNFSNLIGEAVSAVESFHTRYMKEILLATEDPDPRRCCDRMYLLAGSGITEVMTVLQTCNRRVNDCFKRASKLNPGDTKSFQSVLQVLPWNGQVLPLFDRFDTFSARPPSPPPPTTYQSSSSTRLRPENIPKMGSLSEIHSASWTQHDLSTPLTTDATKFHA